MKTSCILNNCQNHPSEVKLFKFPFRKPEILKLWLATIPKDLYIVIKNPSFICERHFEKSLVRYKGGKARLETNAVPTIFNDSNRKTTQRRKKSSINHSDTNCRFCLRKFKEDEKQVEINNYIRKQYFALTQAELNESKVYSENICETCFNSLRDSMTFRRRLLENQKTLEKAFGNFEEIKGKIDDVDTRKPEESADAVEPVKEVIAALKKSSDQASLVETVEVDKTYNVSVKIEEFSDDENQSFDNTTEEVKKEDESKAESLDFMNDWPEVTYTSDSSESDEFEKPSTKIQKSPKASTKLDDGSSPPKTKIHKTLDTKKYVCEICGKYYATAISHKHHYERIHLNIKNFTCDVCGYQVYKKVELVGHLASHFKVRNYFCHLCSAAFITRRALNQHFTKHKNIYDCVCGVNGCTAAFKSKDTLKQHQNEIHFKVHRHFCSECGKGFYRLSKMKQHLQSHFQPDPALAATCTECHKVFKNSQSMKSHLKNYHGERKSTECQYCGTSFSKSFFLKRHILTVHMKQKITCQVLSCHKTFVRHEQYRSHLVKNHQDLEAEKLNELLEGVKTVQVTYDCPEFKLN